MSGLKPIEEGCLAVGINCKVKENVGKFFRVGKFIGKVPGFTISQRWEIDRPAKTTIGGISYHMPECQLIRVDDPDLKEDEEELLIEDEL